MNRKKFLKTAVLTTGALSTAPLVLAKVNSSNALVNSKDSDQMEAKVLRSGEGKEQVVLGDHQILKLSGKDTNGQFTLIEQNNDPGIAIPMHKHDDEDEVFHVLSGALEVKVGEATKILKAGDIGFCPRGIPHSWKVIGNEKAKVMLSIFPSGLETMFQELSELPAGPPDFKKVAEICSKYNIQFV